MIMVVSRNVLCLAGTLMLVGMSPTKPSVTEEAQGCPQEQIVSISATWGGDRAMLWSRLPRSPGVVAHFPGETLFNQYAPRVIEFGMHWYDIGSQPTAEEIRSFAETLPQPAIIEIKTGCPAATS